MSGKTDVLLTVVPLKGWRRELTVLDLTGCTELEVFDVMRLVNDLYFDRGERKMVNISLVPIRVDQLPRWIENNVVLNWWEALRGRVRYAVVKIS